MDLRRLGGVIFLAAAVTLVSVRPPANAAVVAPIVGVADDVQQIAYTDVSAFDDRFEPRVVTITVGSAVRWRNVGVHPHSTTSDNGYWSWGLVTGSSFSIRFLAPGRYGYHCAYHPGMTGTVVVLPASGTPTPTPTGTWSTPTRTSVTPTTPWPTPTGPTPIGPTPTMPWPTPPPPPPPPTSPAEAGEIVLDDTATGTLVGPTDLYAVQPSGAGRRQLTNTADIFEAQPSWSPDRQHVVYSASPMVNDRPSNWGIWILDVATGERRQLTAGPEDYEPDWRPDGLSILFTRISRVGGAIVAAEIGVVAPNGTGYRPIVRLSGGVGSVGNPTWSPDGTRIAFTVNVGSGGELYTANADGSGARRLLAHGGWDDIDPRWSPDGRYIAFAAGIDQLGARLHDIWLIDLLTGVVGTVARHPTWELRRPAWSPDSRTLVFTARHQDSPPRWSLYSVPAVGGDVSGPITSGVEPDWSSTAHGGLPTPMPGATATPTPPATPPTPPPFPTFPPPEPTVPGVTPTVPPAPTFALLTPTTEPTPTFGPTATSTPKSGSPTATSPTSPVMRGTIFLPYAVNQWAASPPSLTGQPVIRR